uniref:ATP synthase F0 subunit 8 n=1 Tax=Monochamus guttulatus TaxID=2079363 RepID=UPI0030E07679
MPQMAPLNWLMLFMFFILIFLLFNIMNYYSYNYNIKISKKSKYLLTYNWKW